MTSDSRSAFRCVRLGAAALALGFVGLTGLAPVSAQDASPVASPAAVVCVSPGLPPGTPTPMDEMGSMDMGTPEGDTADTGTPVAVAEEEEVVTGAPADEATTTLVIATVNNYVACRNEGGASGDPGLYVALESTTYIATQGSATPWDRVASELEGPPIQVTLLDADNVMLWGDGRVSADVQLMVGDYWYNHWRVFLTKNGDLWAWDQEANLPPTPDVDFVAVNGINITETKDETTGGITYAFESFSGSWDFTATDALIFNFSNSGEEPHEAVVVQLPDGADPMGLLDGSVPFEDVTFIGGVFNIEPGGSADLTLIHLPAGTYTMLCFYPSPDGAPHAAHGMVQQFNVVEPAA